MTDRGFSGHRACRPPDPLRSRANYLHFVCFELFPFHAAAQSYGASLGDPIWLQRRSWVGRVLNAMALGNVTLRGLPLALLIMGSGVEEWKPPAVVRRHRAAGFASTTRNAFAPSGG